MPSDKTTSTSSDTQAGQNLVCAKAAAAIGSRLRLMPAAFDHCRCSRASRPLDL